MSTRLKFAGLVLALGTFAFTAPAARAQSQQQNQSNAVQITQQPKVESNTGNAATIAWSTNVQASSKLMYGTNPSQLNQTATAPWGGLTHRVYLKNLQPNTTYYYQAVSEHAAGSGTSATSNVEQFSTSQNGQQASNSGQPNDNDADDQARNNAQGRDNPNDNVRIIAGPIVQNANGNTATLWWQTNDVAATNVRYGTSPSNLSQTAYEPGGSKDHRVQLTNLQPGQTYYYDIDKRYGSVRTTGRFTMPMTNAATTPNMNGQPGGNGMAMVTNGPNLQTLSPTSAVITWSTQYPSSSIVRYGTDPNALTQTAEAPWGSTNHQVTLNNLQPNTHYFFEVISSQFKGQTAANAVATNTGQFQTLNQGQQAMTINPQR